MILVISTSSPKASVALFGNAQQLAFHGSAISERNASGAVSRLLEDGFASIGLSTREGLQSVTVFVADVGPGGFTGVKVGTTMCKVMASSLDAQCAAISSFDLIQPDRVVAVPFKRGHFIMRQPGSDPSVIEGTPCDDTIGYGIDGRPDDYPDAANAGALLPGLKRVSPTELVPLYIVEPSISLPKVPFATPPR